MLVALLLVASVGTASAECAWVLWVMNVDGAWHPLGGYERKVSCDDAVVRLEKGKANPAICLPDTIDPRGPKGAR
ncbi:MAG TPA: hypothetical protein VFB66_28245 [Tepidisphaeraceae bacterium]|nr:hypothetical protein [Tepidisphaeraceae bacterium]